MDRISATIITHNEQDNIERCLNSLRDVADEIVVVDSYSTDRTLEICRRYGCKITQRPFSGFGSQRQYATGLTTHKYVLSIDADEVLSEELRRDIMSIKERGMTHRVYGIWVHSYFCGRQMRHSGWEPKAEIRLFNKRYANWNLRDVAEKITFPDSLMPATLAGEIHHYRCASTLEFAFKEKRHAAMLAKVIAARSSRVPAGKPLRQACRAWLGCMLRQGAWLDGRGGTIIARHRFHTTRQAWRQARDLIRQRPSL